MFRKHKQKLITLAIIALITVGTISYVRYLINKQVIDTIVPQAKAFLEENRDYTEDVEVRSMTSKRFTKKPSLLNRMLNLGKKEHVSHIYLGPVHYYDKEIGEYKEIDTRLVPTEYGWEMKKGNYSLEIPKYADGWLKYINVNVVDPTTNEISELDDESVWTRPVNIEHVPGKLVIDENDEFKYRKVIYKNAYGPNIDLIIKTNDSGVDRFVVIRERPADLIEDLEFSFEIKTYPEMDIKYKTEDNELSEEKLWDKETAIEDKLGITIGKMKEILYQNFEVWDSSNSEDETENRQLINVRLSKNDSKIYLTKIIPKEFLENAEYPVSTDDSTIYGSTTISGRVRDNSCSGNGYITHTLTANRAMPGRGTGGTGANIRAFYYFLTSSIPDTDEISSADIYIYLVSENWEAGDNADKRIYSCDYSTSLTNTDYNTERGTGHGAIMTHTSTAGWHSLALTDPDNEISKTSYTEFCSWATNTGTNTEVSCLETADAWTIDYSPIPYLEIVHAPPSNSAPTISSVTDDSPKEAGQDVTFEVDWNDADGEDIKMLICTTNAVTEGDPSSCTVDNWCTVDDWEDSDPIYCSYTTQVADIGSNDYWAFVCDDEPECSSGSSGSFSVPASIYRSVGPGNTTALASGGGTNNLIISGATATFDNALPDNIGVGDAIQYDSDSKIAFISGRTSSVEYIVKTAAGAEPIAEAGDDEWEIFRSYISLSNAEAGVENSGIDSGVRDFDAGNRDIESYAESWYIACYSDGADATSTDITWDGWTTSAIASIKIYTPFESSEVGTSQRHEGTWDTSKYYLLLTNAEININDDYMQFEGLQIEASTTVANIYGMYITAISSDNSIKINNNIIRISADSAIIATAINFTGGYTDVKAWNNIVYKFGQEAGIHRGIDVTNVNSAYLYNNTVVGLDRGYYELIGTIIFKNNIAQDCADGFTGTFDPSSDYNISDIAGDAPGTHSFQATVAFADSANDDYHLAYNDKAASNKGASLSADSNLSFSDDIDGQTRVGPWDIGADEHTLGVTYYNVSRADYFKEASLVGYWTFDRADLDWQTDTLSDRSGQGNNGAIINISATTSARPGRYGQAMHINDSSEYIEVAHHSSLNITDAITIEAWIKADQTDDLGNTVTSYSYCSASGDDHDQWEMDEYACAKDGLRMWIDQDGYLQDLYNFNLSVSAPITGIQVRMEGFSDGAANNEGVTVVLSYDGGDNWTTIQITKLWTSLEAQTKIFPSVINLWGRSAWTADELTNSNFRVRLESVVTQSGMEDMRVDYVQTRIGYAYPAIGKGGAYAMFIHDDNLYFYLNGSEQCSTSIDTSLHHVVMTYDKDLGGTEEAKLYIDGVLEDTGNYSTAISTNSDNLIIGQAFIGTMDEVRIYNRALSASEIDKIYTGSFIKPNYSLVNRLTSGLVGSWTFNGQDMQWSTNTAFDRSGQGNDGEIINMSTSSSPQPGISGQALEFDGDDDWVEVVHDNSLDIDDTITISYWLKADTPQLLDEWALMIGKIDFSNDAGWSSNVRNYGPDIYLRIDTSEGTNQAGVPLASGRIQDVLDGSWHHISWVLDSGTRKGYKDGIEVVNADYDHGTGFGNSNNLFLGGLRLTNNLNGSIDEVRIYNRALSTSEVEELYRMGARRLIY